MSIFVTILRQILFLVPAMFLLPRVFGLGGLWASFPISDLSAFVATLFFVRAEMSALRSKISLENRL